MTQENSEERKWCTNHGEAKGTQMKTPMCFNSMHPSGKYMYQQV
jgi:hypothetical protein